MTTEIEYRRWTDGATRLRPTSDRSDYRPCVGCGKPIHPALHRDDAAERGECLSCRQASQAVTIVDPTEDIAGTSFELLIELRLARGWQIARISQLTGATAETVRRWETTDLDQLGATMLSQVQQVLEVVG